MSGLDKDRKRNQTIAFRMTPEERQELEARIKVTGKPKVIDIIILQLEIWQKHILVCMEKHKKKRMFQKHLNCGIKYKNMRGMI